MTMAQRTSSAAELTKRPPVPEGFAEAPINKLEFEPAQEPTVGLFYLKNQAATLIGDWFIMDGFYLSSHGERPVFSLVVHKNDTGGVFATDQKVLSQITKGGHELYFLNRDMAEFYVKNILNPFSKLLKAATAKSYNSLVDHFEDRDEVGHFEDGLVLVTASVPARGESGYPVVRGITEVLVNKKLHLVHVVASVSSILQDIDSVVLKNRQVLIEPMYYTSEAVAGFGYADRVKGIKLLTSLRGSSYEDVIQHLARNSK